MTEEKDVNEIQNLLDQARNKYKELESEFSKFNDLRTDLQNKVSGITNFYSIAEKKSSDLEKILIEIREKTDEIESSNKKVGDIKKEIDDYHQKFNEIKNHLDDKSDGLEAKLQWTNEKREEINKKYEDIIKIHTNSENLLKQIESLKNDGESTKQDTLKLKEEVAKWLELISDSSRYNKFNERKKKLIIESYIWMILVIIGFLGLAVFIYAIFKNANGDFISSLNKSLYTTPIIFFLLWATRNYSDIRGYLEKYSFKAILSVSLSSYLELLEEKFGKDSEELERFSFESIRKIFIEPYKEKQRKQVVNFFGKVFLENSESLIKDEINIPDENKNNR